MNDTNGGIRIPTHTANNSVFDGIVRIKNYAPDALNSILMEKGEIRYTRLASLPELLEDLENYTTIFKRYLQDKSTPFSDQIDNQVIRDMGLYYDWKTNNHHSLKNDKISKLISENDSLIPEIGEKLMRKLGLQWNGEGDAWTLIADELEKRNFA